MISEISLSQKDKYYDEVSRLVKLRNRKNSIFLFGFCLFVFRIWLIPHLLRVRDYRRKYLRNAPISFHSLKFKIVNQKSYNSQKKNCTSKFLKSE